MADSKKEKALEALEDAANALLLPQLGEIIDDRFRIIENLGKGATGWVWGVEHLRLQQKFAMKFLLPTIAEDPSWLKRFREEARITSLLGHENIVIVTDFGESEKYGPFLVMEYLEGARLDRLMRAEKPLSFDDILRFAVSISSALSAIHEIGLVHCDLKPQNLFRSKNGNRRIWKMLDFGISTFVTNAVESERLFGTPLYMAPEQAVGLELDSRADQFSLGIILYELLTGRTPWKLNTWADATPESRRRYEVPPPSVVGNCSPSIDATILRAISIRRQERFPTIEDFVASLQEHFEIDIEARSDPFETTHSAKIKISNFERQSLQIDLNNPVEQTPRVVMTFMSADRLRREYRRNLIAGRLFLAANSALEEGDEIGIDLLCEPTKSHVKLAGTVSKKTEEGLGIVIAPLFRKPLNAFLKEQRLGFGFLNRDILQPIPRDYEKPLSVGEALILSKIAEGGHSLGWLRAQCSSLPIDFEDGVTSLIEKEYAQLSQSGMSASSAVLEDSIPIDDDAPSTWTEELGPELEDDDDSLETMRINVAISKREIQDVLRVSRSFVAKQNYLAAISVLESIVDIAPDAALHFELATLFESFANDVSQAKMHIARALEMEPDSAEFLDLDARLEED